MSNNIDRRKLDFNTDEMKALAAKRKLEKKLSEFSSAARSAPKPISNDRIATPSFPTQALGPVLAPAVKAVASLAQADESMSALVGLSVAGYIAQSFRCIKNPHKSVAPLSLITLSVAGTSERKSVIDSFFMKPLQEIEEERNENYASQKTEYMRKLKAHQTVEKGLLNGKNKKDKNAISASLVELGKEPSPPINPTMIVNDLTFEGLLQHAPTMWPSLLITSAEAGQLFGGYAFSKEKKLHACAAMSGFWDGSPVARLQATKETPKVCNKAVGFNFMCQPDVANQLLCDPMALDQGLLGRMLMAKPKSQRGTRFFDNSDEGATQRDSAHAVIKQFYDKVRTLLARPLPTREGHPNEIDPPHLELSKDAINVWATFYNAVEKRQGPSECYADIPGFAGKSGQHALRIAGILSYIEAPDALEIPASIMHRAVKITQWFLDERLRIYTEAFQDKMANDSKEAWLWISLKWDGGDVISLVDISQNITPVRFRAKGNFAPILEFLVKNNYLGRLDGKHTIKGKTRTKCFKINRNAPEIKDNSA